MAIQVRRGNEADFDASKMLPGEWAVSLDTKYVRMCFAPGIVLRMANYESFEADMELIQGILEECEEIQTAIERIKREIDEKASLTIEYSNSASLSATRASEEADRAHEEAERAKNYADSAQSATNVQIATKDTAGIIKGGDNHIAEDGTLTLIAETTETTMPNSCEGRLLFKEIRGKTEKNGNEVKVVAISGIKTHGKNLLDGRGLKENTSYGVTFTPVFDANGNLEYIEANGTNDGTNYSLYNINTSLTIGEEYTLNGCPSGDGDSIYYTVQMSNFGVDTGSGFTGKITENALQRVDIYILNGYTANKLRFYPMIRKADIADSTYEPYIGSSTITFSKPIELNKIGDVQDVIVDGKVKRNLKAIKVTDFNSITVSDDKNWYDATKSYSYELKACNYPIKNGSLVDDLCTHFETYSFANFYANGIENGVLSSSSYIVVNISKSLGICKTVDEFRQWCIDNDVTFYKELAGETTEALPIADQVALNSIKTFDGTTYLEFDSPLQPEFVAEYGTSKVGGYTLEGMLAGRNGELMGKDYANRLTALETSAVNNI